MDVDNPERRRSFSEGTQRQRGSAVEELLFGNSLPISGGRPNQELYDRLGGSGINTGMPISGGTGSMDSGKPCKRLGGGQLDEMPEGLGGEETGMKQERRNLIRKQFHDREAGGCSVLAGEAERGSENYKPFKRFYKDRAHYEGRSGASSTAHRAENRGEYIELREGKNVLLWEDIPHASFAPDQRRVGQSRGTHADDIIYGRPVSAEQMAFLDTAEYMGAAGHTRKLTTDFEVLAPGLHKSHTAPETLLNNGEIGGRDQVRALVEGTVGGAGETRAATKANPFERPSMVHGLIKGEAEAAACESPAQDAAVLALIEGAAGEPSWQKELRESGRAGGIRLTEASERYLTLMREHLRIDGTPTNGEEPGDPPLLPSSSVYGGLPPSQPLSRSLLGTDVNDSIARELLQGIEPERVTAWQPRREAWGVDEQQRALAVAGINTAVYDEAQALHVRGAACRRFMASKHEKSSIIDGGSDLVREMVAANADIFGGRSGVSSTHAQEMLLQHPMRQPFEMVNDDEMRARDCDPGVVRRLRSSATTVNSQGTLMIGRLPRRAKRAAVWTMHETEVGDLIHGGLDRPKEAPVAALGADSSSELQKCAAAAAQRIRSQRLNTYDLITNASERLSSFGRGDVVCLPGALTRCPRKEAAEARKEAAKAAVVYKASKKKSARSKSNAVAMRVAVANSVRDR